MSLQILVPLKRNDSMEEILSCLDVLARPGVEVVFLLAYRPEVSLMLLQLTSIQSGPGAVAAFRAVATNSVRQRQLSWAKEKLRPAYAALHSKGVRLTVHPYTGSLSKTVAILRDSHNRTIVLSAESKFAGRIVSRVKHLLSRIPHQRQSLVVFSRPGR